LEATGTEPPAADDDSGDATTSTAG
jgi:hypothetical protein